MPSCAKIHKTMIWVRFPELALMYYDDNLLMALDLVMGRSIKIDMNTSLATRGRFARVCIELDLNKSLVGQFTLDGKNFKVE